MVASLLCPAATHARKQSAETFESLRPVTHSDLEQAACCLSPWSKHPDVLAVMLAVSMSHSILNVFIPYLLFSIMHRHVLKHIVKRVRAGLHGLPAGALDGPGTMSGMPPNFEHHPTMSRQLQLDSGLPAMVGPAAYHSMVTIAFCDIVVSGAAGRGKGALHVVARLRTVTAAGLTG